ncbi:MAG: autotransporter outer membrane beta-barrel domain-containing protein, partial [Starkeya sp.]|nr:autotransporter outer membrane beta-barrel domain-containing protein [Starkeya sp.]
FVTSGYVVTGGALTLSGSSPVKIRVGSGAASDATMVTTIASTLIGSGGLEKTDYGTLILTGSNSYSGGTTLSTGTLQVSADANLGDAAGVLILNGGTLATTTSSSEP